MSIVIENISKNFGTYKALNQIYLEIQTGSLIALIGPSGSGKSTLLRMIAGLDKPDTGRIWLYGKDTTSLDIQNKDIGFVFQNYALFQHLTVSENIEFGLSIRNLSASSKKKRVLELLKLIQLEEFAQRYPSQLSGGQCQRVALARALAVEPKVLLLDEPFGALDAKVRKSLRNWLKNLHRKISLTTVFVTHDIEEALEIADEIIFLAEGQVKTIHVPQEIFEIETLWC